MTCLYLVMVCLLQIAHIFCNLLGFVSMQRFRFSSDFRILCFVSIQNCLTYTFWDSTFQNFFNGCLQCFIHKRVRLFVILLMVKKKDFVDVKKRFCWWYQYHIKPRISLTKMENHVQVSSFWNPKMNLEV
jgi:hypothetical protein